MDYACKCCIKVILADLTSSIFSQDSSDTSQPEKSFELLSDLSHLSSLLKLIFIPIKSKMKAIPP